MLQVYTGEGKGKTSAALGALMRAVGQGWKVLLVQLFKKGDSGEDRVLETLSPQVKVLRVPLSHPYFSKENPQEFTRMFLQEWRRIVSLIQEEEWNLLILDELNVALRDGFLSWEEIKKDILPFSREREVIITGRGAPLELMEKADLVTRMEKIKHPFDRGVKMRRGVEY